MLRKVNLMVALLATLLFVATQASAQTSGCNCSNASLVGDTVGTRFNLGPGPINQVVGTGIELPGAGPVLGAAGSPPRWNIDFGTNTIRIDFLQQPATYGMGSSFTFSSLDPQLAGCPPAFISGITVTTNKPTSQFNVVAGATFGPQTVTVRIAPNGANLDWQPGEFILITLDFSCDPSACPGNLLRNGDFSAGINVVGNGSLPPSTVANWSQSAGSPQVSAAAGCNSTPGFISMWGNQTVGEAIQQTLTTPIQAGHTYRLTACVRWLNNSPTLPQYVRFRVRASNGAITYTDPATLIGIVGDPSNAPSVPAPGITSTQWTNITLANWTAPATSLTYDTITINPENDNTANDGTTVSWGQIDNVCLQDLNEAHNTGDPHITTVDKVHYDFQSAGEFVALRDGAGLEIQTRQTPIATAYQPGANPHTGLATCVSVNTAVAARVGSHRVTFQPNLNGLPDPSGLQLRVDGVLTTLGANGVALTGGGRVIPSIGGGIEIDFPDGTTLTATPGWWAAQGKWYINLSVRYTSASAGIMGAMAPGSWLPALPNGTSLGARPSSLHQRYVDLYQTFADAWRVTNTTSLFDYASGTSTATFTLRSWPAESGACVIPQQPPVKPIEPRVARQLCQQVTDRNANADCVFDVTVTGEAGFAKTYLLSQQIQGGPTTTVVTADKDLTRVGQSVRFTATVTRTVSQGRGTPTGTVQFILDGEKVGVPVRLNSNGQATWTTHSLKAGAHRIAASYIPERGSVFRASSSVARLHVVRGGRPNPFERSNN